MKKRIVFNLLSIGNNLGDLVSSPVDYYDIPYAHKFNIQKFDIRAVEDSIILYGGGGVLCFAKMFRELRRRSNLVVFWGAGFNLHSGNIANPGRKDYLRPHEKELLAKADIVGIRDFVKVEGLHKRIHHTPCVSCKHKVFDGSYRIEDDIRVYEHKDIPLPLFTTYPRRTNSVKDGGIEDAVAFIAGCNRLVTNSYHGAYWGALLGKQVFVYRPFSTKFRNLPNVKFVWDAEDLSGEVEVVPDLLKKCRDKNDKFYRIFSMFRAIEE